MAIHISSSFDAGAIEVISLERPDDIRLNIRKDNASDFLQWFYYRVSGCAGQQLKMRLLNASQAAYEKGWPDYQAVASYDRQHWFRVPTSYDGKELVIQHEPQANVVYYAYFEPYSHERHLDLLASAASNGWVRQEPLGATIDGRDLDLLVIGNEAPNQPKVWVIARQHPGESMAEWFIEGMLQRLLDHADPVARRLLSQATFYVVPNMNPDGSVRGNLRTNAAGANLNREWRDPSAERSPEVLLVRRAMEASGVELFLDIHGDEALPYVFFSTAEEVPGFSDEQRARQARFVEAFAAASPDFQTEHGYAVGRFQDELLTLASKWVAHRFGCVSLTLEMPFKDNANLPDGIAGWSSERSMRLGAAMLAPILQHLAG